MNGWIKKHRKIMSHWLYEEDRVFSRYEAFDYLLMTVNHQDNKVMMDGKLVDVERGTTITSVRKLCERWKWSNTKVVQFLEALEADGMIEKKSDTKKTVINIVNYGKYQGSDEEETTQKRYENDTETIQKHTNKNVNNDDNDKNDNKVVKKKNTRHKSGEFDSEKSNYADYVWLKPEEYQKLVDLHGLEATTEMIEILNSYKASSGKKYPSDYHTMVGRGWVLDKYKEEQAKKFKVYKGGANQQKQSAFSRLQQLAMEESEREASGNY